MREDTECTLIPLSELITAATSPLPLRRSLRRASTGLIIEDVDEIFPKPFEPSHTIEDVDEIFPKPFEPSHTSPRRKPQKPKRTRTPSQRRAPVTHPDPSYSGPNWTFPIPLTYTMDDQRLSLAYRQYDTNNILKTVMDRNTDPVLKLPRR